VTEDVPVTGEEREREPRGRDGRTDAGKESIEEGEAEESQKVQGPDAKDATHIKGRYVDAAGLGLLAKKEFSDEEGAEEKEDTDAEGSGGAEIKEPGVVDGVGWDVVHAMEAEDTDEGEEAKSIEFGAIVPVQTWLLTESRGDEVLWGFFHLMRMVLS
jgi:hypothetical protein